MRTSNSYDLSIPSNLIDDLSNEIAKRISIEIRREISNLSRKTTVDPPANALPKEGQHYLRPAELVSRLSISRSTLYHWVKIGRFPPPIHLGPRTSAWSVSDIENWERAQIQQI